MGVRKSFGPSTPTPQVKAVICSAHSAHLFIADICVVLRPVTWVSNIHEAYPAYTGVPPAEHIYLVENKLKFSEVSSH